MYNIKRIGVSKDETYKRIKEILEKQNYELKELKEIQYGLQAKLSWASHCVGHIRVFNSKRGTSIDLSQITEEAEKEAVFNLIKSIKSFEKS